MQPLSTREKEVFDLMVEGYNNYEIADKLYLSYATVTKRHICNVMKKTNYSERVKLLVDYWKGNLKVEVRGRRNGKTTDTRGNM